MNIKILLIIMLTMIFAGCTNNQGAKELLTTEGYTDITLTGYELFACSKDDLFHTGFVAKRNGKQIRGTVCEGVLKDKTIRYK